MYMMFSKGLNNFQILTSNNTLSTHANNIEMKPKLF